MDRILPLGNIPSLMHRYVSGELRPSQVVQAVHAQIVNDDGHVWIRKLSLELLLSYARKIETKGIAALPLYGIPFAIEDNIDLAHVKTSRGKAAKQGVCERGSRGKSKVNETQINETQILLSKKALKKDTRYQKDKKRKQCKRRAAIEPIISHLKSDFRLARNYLKGAIGDHINLLMAAGCVESE
jgi:hypothetical protein